MQSREQIFPYIGHILLGLGVIFVIYLIIKARKNGKKKSLTAKDAKAFAKFAKDLKRSLQTSHLTGVAYFAKQNRKAKLQT